jgi:hypothetical protein
MPQDGRRVEARINLQIEAQPDDSTCGPTSLQAVYDYYGDDIGLERVIREVPRLENGGTLAVLLGCHALERGYRAVSYTYDLRVFDPTWFMLGKDLLLEKLAMQLTYKQSPRMAEATEAYQRYLRLGGEIRYQDLHGGLLRKYLKRGIPVLAGLSSTYLYGSARELDFGDRLVHDDVRGDPSGHFVVLAGYDIKARSVTVADPLSPNPMGQSQFYEVGISHLINAIMLGIVTYDANLLVILPREDSKFREPVGRSQTPLRRKTDIAPVSDRAPREQASSRIRREQALIQASQADRVKQVGGKKKKRTSGKVRSRGSGGGSDKT